MTLTFSFVPTDAVDSSLGHHRHICQQMFIWGTLSAFGLSQSAQIFALQSHHESEILTLDQPSLDMLSSTIRSRSRGRVRYEHKVLAESSHSCCTGFSEFNKATDRHQYRHVFPRCWRAALSPFRNVVRVQDLTIVVLDLVAGFWHLFLEQRLHRCGVRYNVPIIDDDGQWLSVRHGGCGHVE